MSDTFTKILQRFESVLGHAWVNDCLENISNSGLTKAWAPVPAARKAVLEYVEQAEQRAELAVNSFVAQIMHGDENHRAWLTQAAKDFNAGRNITALAPASEGVPLLEDIDPRNDKRSGTLLTRNPAPNAAPPSAPTDSRTFTISSGGAPKSIVAGEMMGRSIAQFICACEVAIEHEQGKVAPENHLIALLCDSVRLARENVKLATAPIETAPKADGVTRHDVDLFVRSLRDQDTGWAIGCANLIEQLWIAAAKPKRKTLK